MSGWYNQIVRIENVEKHPNADSLSIYTVMDSYPVCDKTDKYSVGQLVSYIGIDTIVPDTEDFHFLSPNKTETYEENGEIKQRTVGKKYPVGSVPEKYRIIKAKKIRNIYSVGLFVDAIEGLSEGDSIVEQLGLKKMEEEEEENVRATDNLTCCTKSGLQESPPKGWSIPHYDIESLRKFSYLVKEGEEVVFTEKLHGSNASYCYNEDKLWVKSRKLYKKTDQESDMWVAAAKRNNIEDKLKLYPGFVFFAECYGQVKGFRYDCQVDNNQVIPKLRFFDIYDLSSGRYLDYDRRVGILDELEIERVPELYRGPWTTKEEMFAYAEGLTTLGQHVREGYVLVPVVERFEPRLNGRLQLKCVGQGYNLKK